MKLTLLFLSMASLALSGAASADTYCPNEKAKPVPENTVEQGPSHHCSVSIQLFGVTIEIPGPECFQTVYHFPAHSICDAEHNDGTLCASLPKLSVQKETCFCGISLFGIHVLLPICTCTDAGSEATCPNAETQPCPVAIHPH